jgi:hypothetical protein
LSVANLPRGVPFVDLLVPPGTAAHAAEVQTRLDLVTGGVWRVVADDGTFEQSSLPTQPLRGPLDRIWVHRTQPMMPGEPFQEPVSLAVELAMMFPAKVASAGVSGVYAWAGVVVEDARWLLGLILLDWLYNPRIDENGEVVEDTDPAKAQETLSKKSQVFVELFSPEGAQELLAKLPPGALQQVETHQVLMLVGPDGSFDPRYWQGMAMQLLIPVLRERAAGAGDAPAAPAPGAAAPAPGMPAPPAPEPEPDDGLTPLARAQKAAAERAARAEAEGATAEPVEPEIEGGPVVYGQLAGRPAAFVPADRYDAGNLRRWREGDTDGLRRAERSGADFERWVDSGAAFVTEVPFLSRLFLDNSPLHKGALEERGTAADGLISLACHLPRVAPVQAVVIPASGDSKRRILVSSALDARPADVVALAGG